MGSSPFNGWGHKRLGRRQPVARHSPASRRRFVASCPRPRTWANGRVRASTRCSRRQRTQKTQVTSSRITPPGIDDWTTGRRRSAGVSSGARKRRRANVAVCDIVPSKRGRSWRFPQRSDHASIGPCHKVPKSSPAASPPAHGNPPGPGQRPALVSNRPWSAAAGAGMKPPAPAPPLFPPAVTPGLFAAPGSPARGPPPSVTAVRSIPANWL